MFEKDAEDKAFEKYPIPTRCDEIEFERNIKYEEGFKDGAEFGYNKANEWHFVKDKLPPCGEDVLLYYGVNIMGKVVVSTGCIDCHGTWYKNVDGEPIQWKEIVLP